MTTAILGSGLMGSAAAQRLHETGEDLIVWNRHSDAARTRLGDDIAVAEHLETAATRADTWLLFLSDAAAIDETLSALPGQALQGKTVIQMGTIAPSESRGFKQRVEEAGGDYFEAPVLGSLPEARGGRLLLMVGADATQYETHRPLLSKLGKTRRIGPVGEGAAIKLALNQLIAGLTTSFALSLRFVLAEDGDVDAFMEILRDSALYAPTFDKKLDKMLSDDYGNPNFPLKHLDKDVKLFLRAAAEHGLDTTMLEGIEALLRKGLELGHGDLDYSALARSITRQD